MSIDCGRCAPARTRYGDFARRAGATPASFRVFDTLTTSKNEEGGFARGCSRSIRTGLRVGLYVNRFCPGPWFNLVEWVYFLIKWFKKLNHDLHVTEPSVWSQIFVELKNQLFCSIFGSVTKIIVVTNSDAPPSNKKKHHYITIRSSCDDQAPCVANGCLP
jgi:hypothetical protein